MGYIAPIINYQAMQYAERDMEGDYDPFTFAPVHKTNYIVNAGPQHTLSHSPYRRKNIKNTRNLQSVQRDERKKKLMEDKFAQLTGTGKLFNETI